MEYKSVNMTVGELLKMIEEGKVKYMNNNQDKPQISEKDDTSLPPITQLENKGHDVFKDEFGDVVFGIGNISDPMKEVMGHRESMDGLELTTIPEDQITNYNSVWEITQTGWNSDKGLYPYICVNDKWYRWDQRWFLRENCGMVQWSKENTSRYLGSMMRQKEGPVWDRPNFNKVKSVKVGRNEKCPCGSGKKYKKCCLELGGK